MKKVVSEATGRQVGLRLPPGLLRRGAIEVSLDEAGPGDIVQIASDRWTSPDADYAGLHTAIILEATATAPSMSIDSNQLWDGVVRLRSGVRPGGAVLRPTRPELPHLPVHGRCNAIGRAARGAAARTNRHHLRAGDRARVNTPGECLNLRAEPFGNVITLCSATGPGSTVIGSTVTATGIGLGPGPGARRSWLDGFASTCRRSLRPPRARPAPGRSTPVFQYRAFIPLASSD